MNYTVFQSEPRKTGEMSCTGDINELLIKAMHCVIYHMFQNISSAVVVTISTSTGSSELWFRDIMDKLFATWGLMTYQLVIHDSKRGDVRVPGKRLCNIIMIDSLDSLHRTNIAEYNRNYDTEEYFFIFLQIYDVLMPLERQKILKYCLYNYWLHCNVMVQNAKGEVLIYTYYPFQVSGCYQTDPVLINQFDGEHFVNFIIFPEKLHHLHGCPVKLSTWDIPPFMELQENSEDPLRGLETVILRSLSKDMNFSLVLDDYTADRNLGNNFNYEEKALELLRKRETNITAGYYRRTAARDATATSSVVVYNIPLIPVVMRRKAQYGPLDILTFPFDDCTWWLLVISSICMIAINFLASKLDPSFYSWDVIEVLLGVASWRLPKCISLRSSFLIWVLSTFILRSVYQSLLFYLYSTNFYRKAPTTLDELVQHNYKAVCSQRSEPFLKYISVFMDNDIPLIVLNTTDEMEPLRFIENNCEQNFVALAATDFIYYYAFRELQTGNAILLLSVAVSNQQIGFYFTKHSYLVRRFNQRLLRLHYAGLLEYWQKLSILSYRITKRTNNVRKYQTELFIDMKQLLALMPAVVFLNLIAVVIFVMELLSKKIGILQNIF